MLRNARALLGHPLLARDGAIGSLIDLYFDDRRWSLRYFVLDTGRSMPRRVVLVAPGHALAGDAPPVHVRLSREELEKCPELDEDKPVYLQHDMAQLAHRGDPHLRSCAALMGYGAQALDGGGGEIKDELIDIASWRIESLVVDTGGWRSTKWVLVAPNDVARIDWVERKVHLRLTRQGLRARLMYPSSLVAPLRTQ